MQDNDNDPLVKARRFLKYLSISTTVENYPKQIIDAAVVHVEALAKEVERLREKNMNEGWSYSKGAGVIVD